MGHPPTTSEFAGDLKNLLEADFSIHYHVWTDQDVRELLEYTRAELHLDWQPLVFWKAHFYRKMRGNVAANSMRAGLGVQLSPKSTCSTLSTWRPRKRVARRLNLSVESVT